MPWTRWKIQVTKSIYVEYRKTVFRDKFIALMLTLEKTEGWEYGQVAVWGRSSAHLWEH